MTVAGKNSPWEERDPDPDPRGPSSATIIQYNNNNANYISKFIDNIFIVSHPIVPHFLVFLTLLVGLVVPANPEKVV